MSLAHYIYKIDELTSTDIEQMYVLMERYYENVSRRHFERDLYKKSGVLVVYDSHHQICGFTTYALYRTESQGESISVLYSGDTIIEQAYWGAMSTTRQFTALLSHCLTLSSNRLYWFLLSKGFRTYQLLPLYFKNFFPTFERETPVFEKQLIQYLSQVQFGDAFCDSKGIIQFGLQGDYLKKQFDQTNHASQSPHVNFFLKRNPNYHLGDNLPCLAEITERNFQPIVTRWLKTIAQYEFAETHT